MSGSRGKALVITVHSLSLSVGPSPKVWCYAPALFTQMLHSTPGAHTYVSRWCPQPFPNQKSHRSGLFSAATVHSSSDLFLAVHVTLACLGSHCTPLRQWLFLTQHRNASFLFPQLSLTSSHHTPQNTSHEGHGDSPTTRSHNHSSTISIGLPMLVLPDYLIAAMAQEGEIVCHHVAKPHKTTAKQCNTIT